jgi:hypothetical protein
LERVEGGKGLRQNSFPELRRVKGSIVVSWLLREPLQKELHTYPDLR